jgi:hypothetical protein
MSALPERYQRYARPAAVQPAEVQLYDERQPAVREPSVWVESADDPNLMVRIPKRYVQSVPVPEQRDLSPQPLFDQTAQRLLCGGVGGGVLLWGGGQLLVGLSHVVSALSGVGVLLFFLALAGARAAFGGGRRAGTRIEVHNHASWFGHTNTNL